MRVTKSQTEVTFEVLIVSSLGLNFAKILRNYRRGKNLTQQAFADKIHVSRATINRWEQKGGGNATLDEIELISEALGVSLIEILGLQKMKHKGYEIVPEYLHRIHERLYKEWELAEFGGHSSVDENLISIKRKKE